MTTKTPDEQLERARKSFVAIRDHAVHGLRLPPTSGSTHRATQPISTTRTSAISPSGYFTARRMTGFPSKPVAGMSSAYGRSVRT
jgi:hypothetical protein